MFAAGTELMARPKAKRGLRETTEPAQPARTTIINLKGSEEQAAWLEAVHRKTHLAKSVIVRLALTEWAERHGHQAFPSSDDEA
jgi:hypothetical protein